KRLRVGDWPVHLRIHPLRLQQWPLAVYSREDPPGYWRRDDGSGRKARRFANYGKKRSDAFDRLHHVARTGRAGHRASGGRIHYDIYVLALDLLSERAARNYRNRTHHAVDQESARRSRSLRLVWIRDG